MVRPSLAPLVGKRLRIFIVDGRQLSGKLLAFDKHMNLVVDETQETRTTKAGATEQRTLGLVILRGDTVVTTVAEPDVGNAHSSTEAAMETA